MSPSRLPVRRPYLTVAAYSGRILWLASFLFFLPPLALPFYPEERIWALSFLIPGLSLGVVGWGLWRGFRPKNPATLSFQDGAVAVLFVWSVASVFAAFPMASAGRLTPVQALFESVSAWTTTGLSVVDVENAPRLLLLWRSLLQLAGGAGLAIFLVALAGSPNGTGLSAAEGRTDQLVPHIRSSTKLVLSLYGAYALIGIAGYLAAGLSLFDSVNHAFAAVSTGGFSTRGSSIGAWDRVAVEAVSIPLMLLGNLNFLTAFLLVRGRFRAVARNGEIRLLVVVAASAFLLAFLYVSRNLYPQMDKALRVALFETLSALTTTGFSTVSYGDWNGFGRSLLIVLMIIGGGTCSTAGGVKQARVHLLFRSLFWEIRGALLPPGALLVPVMADGERETAVTDGKIRGVGVYFFLYLVALAVGTLLLAGQDIPLEAALFETASALGTVGLSVGVVSATATSTTLGTLTAAMFLGRLEFLVVFVALARLWRDFVSNDR